MEQFSPRDSRVNQFPTQDTRGSPSQRGGTLQRGTQLNHHLSSQNASTQCQICGRLSHTATKCWYR